jgi:hypothetical protein
MLKFSRYSPQDVERRAASALEALLHSIPTIYVQHIEHAQESIDFAIHVRANDGGKEYLIGCEVKSNGQPRYAETALLQLEAWRATKPEFAVGIFVAPYISPAVRTMCDERDVSYLDLAGNCRIKFGPVYIERAVATAPPAEQRELKSIYKPKSARVLRVLLEDPRRAWKLKELSEVSGVSLGHVSNVRNALRDRNWINAASSGTVLLHPGELLDEWRDNYEIEGDVYDFYTTFHGASLKKAIGDVLNESGEKGAVAVLSSYSAAEWIAPYGRTGKTYFYADYAGLENLDQVLSLKPVKSGANIQITIPRDDAVFLYCKEPFPGTVHTSLVQTYLDLYVSGERGKEAAEYLREEKMKW